MAKHIRVWNQSVYERYLREGRGRGDGPGYTPWIRVQDFASRGVVSRVKGRTTGRVHHLMSNNELAYFYLLDWSEHVLDIREQYPLLDLEYAMRVAAEAGIKYPADRASGYPYVLTCDFMITTAQGLIARTVKMTSELGNARVLEKLEIERRYWAAHGVDWKIVTEKEISYQRARNIEWLYAAQGFSGEAFCGAKALMLELYNYRTISITEMARTVEAVYSLEQGIGLLLFKRLVLDGEIHVDMDRPFHVTMREALVAA